MREPPDRSPRPQVVAHRGSSADRPEHTLAAYDDALDAGADALECDVRLTRDGHLVCVHDRTLERTSSGRGPVSTRSLAELDALDWSSWRDGGASGAGGAGVLTLRRLLGLVRDAGRPVGLAIETKHPTRWGGRVERELVRLLGEHGWDGASGPTPVRVMSFSATALARTRVLAPGLPLVLLRGGGSRVREGLPPGVGTAGPGLDVLRRRPDLVQRWHDRGYAVHVWTVDEPDDVRWCLGLGVDAVITNRPRAVRALVDAAVGGSG